MSAFPKYRVVSESKFETLQELACAAGQDLQKVEGWFTITSPSGNPITFLNLVEVSFSFHVLGPSDLRGGADRDSKQNTLV